MKIQRNLFLLPCRPKYTVPSQFFLEQYDPRTFESQKDMNEIRLESECSTRMTAWGTFLVSAVDIFVRCIDDAWSMFSFTQKCFISVICTMIYARHLLCSWFARCGGTAVIFSAVAVFLWKSWT